MGWRTVAVASCAVAVPLVVTLSTAARRDGSAPVPRRITSSTASVPSAARGWLGPANGATRPIEATAYCDDVLSTPEPELPSLTPAPDLPRVTADVGARLAFRADLKLRGRPGDGAAFEKERLGVGYSQDYPAPELMLRLVPFEAMVAVVPATGTRVYALAEPLDAAVDKLRARADVIGPRVACGVFRTHAPWHGRSSRVEVEGFVRVVDILVPMNSCEPSSYLTVRLFRRGEVTYLVGAGNTEAYENGRFVPVEAPVLTALSR